MPLGTEVGLGPGHIVLDGSQLSPKRGISVSPLVTKCVSAGPCGLDWINFKKGHSTPTFRPMSSVAKRLYGIKMLLGVEVGLGPGDTVLDEDPAPPRKGTQQPPTVWPMSIVDKRSLISATADLL